MKHFYGYTVQDIPQTSWDIIKEEARKHRYFVISVMNEDEAITARQRAWYKGVCIKQLSEHFGDSRLYWDRQLKLLCGQGIFKAQKIKTKDDGGKTEIIFHLDSIANKSKKQITNFIENILDMALQRDWPITPPDPELRKKK